MLPLAHFQGAWERANQLSVFYAYLVKHLAGALRPDELLRAEWVARISALDLYVHELVCQRMLEIFERGGKESASFLRFQVCNETLFRIRAAATLIDASAAFELEVRSKMGILTFQDPEKIDDGIRLISDVELWNEIAVLQGATPAFKTAQAKSIKRGLSLLVDRRNKIAHEGDLQPGVLRTPWPISRDDLQHVTATILGIVEAIDQVVNNTNSSAPP